MRKKTRAKAQTVNLQPYLYPGVAIGVVLVVAITSLVLAQEGTPTPQEIDSVDTSGAQHVALTGAVITGDVHGDDTSAITIAGTSAQDRSIISGDITGDAGSHITLTHVHANGNTYAYGTSRVIMTDALVDGNVTIEDQAEVSIDSQTVVQGDIEGVLLRSENGYSVYGAYPAQ